MIEVLDGSSQDGGMFASKDVLHSLFPDQFDETLVVARHKHVVDRKSPQHPV